MARQFTVPLSQEDQSIFLSLPRHEGAVVNPKYLHGAAKARVEAALLAWCESHPGSDWPQWVCEWHLEFQTTRRRALVVAPGSARG